VKDVNISTGKYETEHHPTNAEESLQRSHALPWQWPPSMFTWQCILKNA